MRTSAEQLKLKLFGIEQYTDIISNFKNQIEGFNLHEKKLLRNGRYNRFYGELENCVKGQNSRKDEKEGCLKESLHRECI